MQNQGHLDRSNLGPKKKQFVEQFSASMSGCMVKDIIEDNGQELYYCDDGKITVSRNFDSKTWNFRSIGNYDAKNNIFKVNGNYTGSVS
jgi:hypothetical protein